MNNPPKIAPETAFKNWKKSPLRFISDVWGLTPQPRHCNELHLHKKECFGEFIRGKHITWQQYLILKGVEDAIQGRAPRRLSIASGRGIGKDATLSWLLHWFLFTRVDAQIGATAPSREQLYDVLWKELMIWRERLPAVVKEHFVWSTSHYRIKESPATWFARARTARKESPDAIRGLHGESVFLAVDEASGVPDEVYIAGEGSLTNEDTLIVLIGNPTRREGYFFETHNGSARLLWQRFSFSSLDSPIVDKEFVQKIEADWGRDSDVFKAEVLGEFPKAGGMLAGGWFPLFGEYQEVPDLGKFIPPLYMGIDPSASGRNRTTWVVRDAFQAKIVAEEQISTTLGIAEKTMTIASRYNILPQSIFIDAFGVGHNISQEIALASNERIKAISVGERVSEQRFLNIRAISYWRLKEWFARGGKLIRHPLWAQLKTIHFKRAMSGKITIMSKEVMMDHGWISPDGADALMLTFIPEHVGKQESFPRGTYSYQTVPDEEIAERIMSYGK